MCVSLAEVQGNCPIFMEIRDNAHQLSFTLSIFISFLLLTLYVCHPLSARFGGVFWTAETGASLRSLPWELYQTHTHTELEGRANFIWPTQPCTEFPQGFSHFLQEEKWGFLLPLALPAAHTQPLQYTYLRCRAKEPKHPSSNWGTAWRILKLRTRYFPGWRNRIVSLCLTSVQLLWYISIRIYISKNIDNCILQTSGSVTTAQTTLELKKSGQTSIHAVFEGFFYFVCVFF